jgi:hypothetical protein
MRYPSTPRGRLPRFRGVRLQGGWPAVVFYPFGHPTPQLHLALGVEVSRDRALQSEAVGLEDGEQQRSQVQTDGQFHDPGDAEWMVIRGQLRGFNDTPSRPISRQVIGCPQGVFGGLSYYAVVLPAFRDSCLLFVCSEVANDTVQLV